MLCECNLKAGTTFDKTVWLDYCSSNRSADTRLGRKKNSICSEMVKTHFQQQMTPEEINDLIQAIIL